MARAAPVSSSLEYKTNNETTAGLIAHRYESSVFIAVLQASPAYSRWA